MISVRNLSHTRQDLFSGACSLAGKTDDRPVSIVQDRDRTGDAGTPGGEGGRTPERRSLGRDSTWLAEWWRRGMKENQCMVVKDKQIILWSWRGNVEMGRRRAGIRAGVTSRRALRATVRNLSCVLQTTGATEDFPEGTVVVRSASRTLLCNEPSAAMWVFSGGGRGGCPEGVATRPMWLLKILDVAGVSEELNF